MKLVLGADHGGYRRKEAIKAWLKEEGYEINDVGTYSEESTDYPAFGHQAALEVQAGQADLGIIFCGSGIGIGIAANKVSGIRCATVSEPYSARLARNHNNANMIALGARIIGLDMTKEIIRAFLGAEFEGGRHERRVGQIEDIKEN